MITATDLFCGAGGSSTGLVAAGVAVQMAANHWQLAIETHNTNHPTTEHDIADLRSTHPSRYPRTDILWCSPECTNHSLAKGRKRKAINQMDLWGESGVDPAEERSRATMREVVEFTAYHRYAIVIVENVVDIRHWQHYDDWLNEVRGLGYEHRTLYLNAQFFNVPQSRDRWYTVFWRKGITSPDLDFRPRANCAEHGTIEAVQVWKKQAWGRYNRQYVYRCPTCGSEVHPAIVPAAAVIDWSLPCPTVGERSRPLKPKTIERIKAGLRKFVPDPMVLDTAYSAADHTYYVRSADQPLSTQTARQSFALASPFLMQYYTRDNAQSSVDAPLPVVTTEKRHALVVPFLAVMKNSAKNGYTQPPIGADEPLTTIVASASQHALVMAYYGNAPTFARASDDPLPTMTTVQRHALIAPDDDRIVDACGFRMLEPEELKRGMSFPDSYVVLGNKRDQVRQVGNAVACNVAEWIARRCVEALAG